LGRIVLLDRKLDVGREAGSQVYFEVTCSALAAAQPEV